MSEGLSATHYYYYYYKNPSINATLISSQYYGIIKNILTSTQTSAFLLTTRLKIPIMPDRPV
jgi:hypothetical protein